MNELDISLEIRGGLARLRFSGALSGHATPSLEAHLRLGRCSTVPTIVDLRGLTSVDAQAAEGLAQALLKCPHLGCVLPPEESAVGRTLRTAMAVLPKEKRPVEVAASDGGRTEETERRRSARSRVRTPVELRWGRLRHRGWIVDLSESGAQVEVALGATDLLGLRSVHGRALRVELRTGPLRARVARLVSLSRACFGVEFRDRGVAARRVARLLQSLA